MLRAFGCSGIGVSVFFLSWCMAPFSRAQELPSAPVPVIPQNPANEQPLRAPQPVPSPSSSVPVPGPVPAPVLGPPPYVPPPPYSPYPVGPAPVLVREPLMEFPAAPPDGWFGTLELNLLGVHVKNRLQSQLQLDGFDPNLVHLPTAELDWAGSPRVELGYRFCDGWGEFVAGYRYLSTDGAVVLPGFDLDGSDGILKSRLSMNVVDLDYGSRDYCLDRRWNLNWRVGARLATIFADSRAEAFFLEQRTSAHFVGAGPHAALNLSRSFDWPGVGLFARLGGAALIGHVNDSFEEVVADNDGNLTGTAARFGSTQTVPVLEFQLGVSWTSCWHHHWSRLALGYEFEQWWDIGNAGDSHADLTAQGIFFRAEFGF